MALKGISRKLIYCTSEEVELGTVVRKKTNLESDIFHFDFSANSLYALWTKNDPEMEKGKRQIGFAILGS